MLIENVSDTARWVATYRAMETERPDAIFRDPFARQLAGEHGQNIVKKIGKSRSRAWAMIVRTKSLDEMILDAIAQGPVDLVVNLAAGLDARPWRLPLPATLRWVDVDLPEILAHKAGVIGDARPACRYEAVTADLADPAVRAETLGTRLRRLRSQTLVVSEGLLIYLTAEQVDGLARDLAAQGDSRRVVVRPGQSGAAAHDAARLGRRGRKRQRPFSLRAGGRPGLFPFGRLAVGRTAFHD